MNSSYQNGYATVLTAVLFSVLSLSILAMFNSGQIVTHKLKLQNAVDAAAYSSAVVVSRELNYMAYTNRAMVANQVMVGQVVGMVSWIKMMKESSENLEYVGDIVSIIPIVGTIINGYLQGLSAVSDAADTLVSDWVAGLVVPWTNTVIRALSTSQYTVHQATQALILATFPKVLRDNDPDAVMAAIGGANLLALGKFKNEVDGFSKQTTEARPSSEHLGQYDNFAQVVMDSRDNFTDGRSYNWMSATLPYVVKMWIHKRGGNEFERKQQDGKYVWEWSAMDTVSLWTQWYNPTKLRWGSKRETLPIGWGAGYTSNESGAYDNFNSSIKWDRARKNRIAGEFAEQNYGDEKVGGTSGLQRFYYMEGATPPAFIAFVAKDSGSVRTWKETVNSNGGQISSKFDIEENGSLRGGKMYSLAKSEPYFSRSHDLAEFKRDDQPVAYVEYANLMNPYWQARLTPLTTAERNAVLLALPD